MLNDPIPTKILDDAILAFIAYNTAYDPDSPTTPDSYHFEQIAHTPHINLLDRIAIISDNTDECTITLLITYDDMLPLESPIPTIRRIELECDTYYTIIHDPDNCTRIDLNPPS